MPSDLANLSEALPGPPFASPRHAWLRAHSRSGTRTFRQRLPPDRAEAFAPATVASPRHPSVSRGCRAVANHIGSQHNSPSFERSLHRNVDFHALAPAHRDEALTSTRRDEDASETRVEALGRAKRGLAVFYPPGGRTRLVGAPRPLSAHSDAQLRRQRRKTRVEALEARFGPRRGCSGRPKVEKCPYRDE